MRKSILVSFAVLFAAIVAIGCKRTPKEYVYDVYVAGMEEDSSMGGSDFKALCWKNGEPTKLSKKGKFGVANSVFVSGNDVYVSGYEYVITPDPSEPGTTVGVLWKNGKLTKLTDPAGKKAADALSVFVSGSDIYVAGSEEFGDNEVAMLWKNNKGEKLTDGSLSSYTYSVFVSDGVVYVAGGINGRPTLWTDKSPLQLTDKLGGARSVFVSGDDVYVAGRADKKATVWKDGVEEVLTDGPVDDAGALSIFVSGDNVYAVGYEMRGDNSVAVVWSKKAGSDSWEAEELTEGTRAAAGTSVFVIDNHVYVAGYERDEASDKDIAMLWTKKAGSDSWEAKEMTKGKTSAVANSVYVVKREKK